LPHCFLKAFSQSISAISAYKDPVENHYIKKIIDKFVTEFFVVILGIVWHCSSKQHVRHDQYTIIIYDVFGNQLKINGIRTNFNTYQVANNYITKYQNRFPHYDFSISTKMSEIKRKILFIKF
jgi:hypothetical protein